VQEANSLKGLKLCTVDIPQQCSYSRARALLPHMPGRAPRSWSLSLDDSVYVRPNIIDVTKARGTYIWQPSRPGPRGFRVSNTPGSVLRELNFGSEGVARTTELVHDISRPESVYVQVRIRAIYLTLLFANK
jgi:hypothetical protein